MNASIKWTPEARTSYYKNIVYLKSHWSQREVDRFKLRVNDVLEQMKKYPEIHAPSHIKAEVRKAKINKKIDLYYRYDDRLNQVHLITFWNVKRNPFDLNV